MTRGQKPPPPAARHAMPSSRQSTWRRRSCRRPAAPWRTISSRGEASRRGCTDARPEWRDFVISEYDYSVTPMRDVVGVASRDARLFMVFDGRFKLIHAEGGFPADVVRPGERSRRVRRPGEGPRPRRRNRPRLYDCLARWGRRMSQRVTCSDTDVEARRGRSARRGVLPFLWDGSEVPEELTSAYRGPVAQNHLSSLRSQAGNPPWSYGKPQVKTNVRIR